MTTWIDTKATPPTWMRQEPDRSLCDKCRGPVHLTFNNTYTYTCPKCGIRAFNALLEWNTTPKVVWLRSNAISYTAEIPNGLLQADGRITGRPDLADFKWEKWP